MSSVGTSCKSLAGSDKRLFNKLKVSLMEDYKVIASIYYSNHTSLAEYPISHRGYKRCRKTIMNQLEDGDISLARFHYPSKNTNNYFIKGKEIAEVEFNKLEKIHRIKFLLS